MGGGGIGGRSKKEMEGERKNEEEHGEKEVAKMGRRRRKM